MLGTNPKRPPDHAQGDLLAVVDIFPTLQGEGLRAGQPAVFIRLGGCNLACNFCDTEFEAFEEMALETILEKVEQSTNVPSSANMLVVITGGEPFRQNIVPLCEQLLGKRYMVQIETNGTLYRDIPRGIEIVCSPKANGNGYHMLRKDLLTRVDALKFIISASRAPYTEVPDVGQKAYPIPIFLQPMDEGCAQLNNANIAHAVRLCQNYGYRLSLQMHKILGMP